MNDDRDVVQASAPHEETAAFAWARLVLWLAINGAILVIIVLTFVRCRPTPDELRDATAHARECEARYMRARTMPEIDAVARVCEPDGGAP